MHSDFGEFAKK